MKRLVDGTVAGLCAASWALAEWVIRDSSGPGDLVVYRHTARLLDAGLVPYRDFDVEYPPLATGLFWVVDRIPGSDTGAWSIAMLACLIATALSAVAAARTLGYGTVRQVTAGAIVAATPLLLGGLVANRYDLAVAALLGGVLVAALRRKMGWAWTLLAIATAIKLTPVVVAPVLMIWHLRQRGSRQAVAGTTAFGVAVAATIAPFAVIAPEGTWRLFSYHLERPAQVESFVASLVHLTNRPYQAEFSFGSDNLVGAGPDTLAIISTALVAVALVGIIVAMARGPAAHPDRQFVHAMAATLVAVVAFAKVASPQYLVWLLPAVLLIAGWRGRVAGALVLAIFGLTHTVYPRLYGDLVSTADRLPVDLLTVRNGLLILLLLVAWPTGRRHPTSGEVDIPRSPSIGEPHSAATPGNDLSTPTSTRGKGLGYGHGSV